MLHGLRPSCTFRIAATKYLQDYAHKKSIGDDAIQLKMLDPFIGELDLRQVHMGSLQAFIAKRRAEGVIPEDYVKNGEERLVVLNRVAALSA